MLNWNTDEKALRKRDPQAYKLWRLIQLINYGLDGEKLDEREIKKAWPEIKDRLAINKRKTLEWLLWNKKWVKPKGLLPDRSNYWSWYSKSRTS